MQLAKKSPLYDIEKEVPPTVVVVVVSSFILTCCCGNPRIAQVPETGVGSSQLVLVCPIRDC